MHYAARVGSGLCSTAHRTVRSNQSAGKHCSCCGQVAPPAAQAHGMPAQERLHGTAYSSLLCAADGLIVGPALPEQRARLHIPAVLLAVAGAALAAAATFAMLGCAAHRG